MQWDHLYWKDDILYWKWNELQQVYNLTTSLEKTWFNTLRPSHNCRHFADDIFKCIFLNENVGVLLKISLKFVPKVWIDNIPALVQMMAWHRPGDKPLSEPMLVSLLTHICITRPQWFNGCIVTYMLHRTHGEVRYWSATRQIWGDICFVAIMMK